MKRKTTGNRSSSKTGKKSPYETKVKPMFDLLGTSKDQKVLKLHETDHYIPRNELIKETLARLDHYLSPVK